MPEQPTTKLEAVNEMLSAVGEAPIVSLSGDLPAEISLAVTTLDNTSRKVQLVGWWFNEEEKVTLSRHPETGHVVVPGNTINVDLTQERFDVEVIHRGTKLYDKLNHTFVFSFNPECTITYYLSWDELPEAAREYIKIKAARIFQARTVGDGLRSQFTKEDEAEAFAVMNQLNNENDDWSIFDSYDIASIVARKRPQPTSIH